MTQTAVSEPGATPTADPLEAFKKTWRYKIGLLLIIGGHVILLAAIVLPAVGIISAGMAAAGVVVGEVTALASIVFLGMQGFKAIKAKIFGAVKVEFEKPVGRFRHTIGIILLVLNLFTSFALGAFAWAAYGEAPDAVVWGMSFDAQASFYESVFLVGELAFPIAIVVLGADWWQRFRELFVWHPPT